MHARDLWPSVFNGLRGRCPACGEGRLFGKFLKVADRCPACGDELYHHRADDMPAYIVITIVGHIVVPLAFAVEIAFRPEYAMHLLLWLAMIVVLSLTLLQWALRMHGFDSQPVVNEHAALAVRPVARRIDE